LKADTQKAKCALSKSGYSNVGLFYEVTVQDNTMQTLPYWLIIGKPITSFHLLTGYSTEGYITYNSDSNELVYLKDIWQLDHNDLKREGDIYQKLNNAQVKCIPELICASNIIRNSEKQTMITKEIAKKVFNMSMAMLEHHVHY
jgi:hypothetical protein